MELSVVFVGTAGSVPTARRGLPASLVRHGGSRILIDCGEGTQRQLVRSTGLVDLDLILISHLHADHWLGLPGLLKTYELRDREKPLTIKGPRGLEAALAVIESAVGRTRYELIAEEISSGESFEVDGLHVAAFQVDHRGAANGYALFEPPRPGRVDLDRARSLGLQPGPDLGRLQRGEPVGGISPGDVLGPDRVGRKIVFSGDTKPCESLALAAHGADLLVHEATFLDEEADRAALKGHSTAAQAAEIALSCKVSMLALNHTSSRYGGGEIRDEARRIFARTWVPRDFDSVEIPYSERGEPIFIKHDHGSQPAHGDVPAKRAAATAAIVEP